MKKACLVTSKYLRNNNIFNKYIELQKEFENSGYFLATDDINSIKDSEIIFYLDMPKLMPSINKIQKLTGYTPKTEISSGLDNFVIWFKKYYRV